MTLTETRRVRKPHACVDCGSIIQPWQRDEPERQSGKFTGRRRHIACPPIQAAAQQMLAQARLNAATNAYDPIPTRPVQKHYSEAVRKRFRWPELTWWAIAAILLLIAVSGLVASYGGGQ